MKLKIGEVVYFGYDSGMIGKYPQKRSCHIEQIGYSEGNILVGRHPLWIRGWDSTSHGYRTFSVCKMVELD